MGSNPTADKTNFASNTSYGAGQDGEEIANFSPSAWGTEIEGELRQKKSQMQNRKRRENAGWGRTRKTEILANIARNHTIGATRKSTHSVVASYKPPMLVTWARFPVCAVFFIPAFVPFWSWKTPTRTRLQFLGRYQYFHPCPWRFLILLFTGR